MNKCETSTAQQLEISAIKQDFPILQQKINNKRLVYLDNAATTQKPLSVLNAMQSYYLQDNANIHRGVHSLSVRATDAYEKARETIRKFINAPAAHEVIFVDGTTEAINLVASSFGQANVKAGDEIIISTLEHHSNIVPWQMLCDRVQAHLKVIPLTLSSGLDVEAFEKLLSKRTKLVSISHVSNAIGVVNPVKQVINLAHAAGAVVLVDGAQAVAHLPVDVVDLDCDFYVFSAHKLYGPTGIGVLFGKTFLLESMPPYQGGGNMISTVAFEKTTYNKLPYKFEAGTPNIAGVIGFAEAVRYLNNIGFSRIQEHEEELFNYLRNSLASIQDVRLIGSNLQQTAVLSFVIDRIHPHDIGTILDNEGIAIRAGHHCAMPLMDWLNLPATARASVALYNTKEDVDALVEGIEKVKRLFA